MKLNNISQPHCLWKEFIKHTDFSRKLHVYIKVDNAELSPFLIYKVPGAN